MSRMLQTGAQPGAIKHDNCKPQLSLLSSIWIGQVISSLEAIKERWFRSTSEFNNTLAYNYMTQSLLDWNNHTHDSNNSKKNIADASAWMMLYYLKIDSTEALSHYLSTRSGFQLLSGEWLIDVTNVLMFGATKYSAHNWRLSFKFCRVYDAILRHIFEYNSGRIQDEESKLEHLSHASCNLMFLTELQETHEMKEFDDRYRPETNIDKAPVKEEIITKPSDTPQSTDLVASLYPFYIHCLNTDREDKLNLLIRYMSSPPPNDLPSPARDFWLSYRKTGNKIDVEALLNMIESIPGHVYQAHY